MRLLTCAMTRRRLNAYHDGELPVAEQIAVGAHLDWCDACAALSAEIVEIGAALRAGAPGRRRDAALGADEAVAFSANVVGRALAERRESVGSRLRSMFDDLRLVYVSLSAAAAAMVCIVSLMGMMRFATEHRPDSLAAILSVMAGPFDCENASEIPDMLACQARWLERFQRANESAEQDAVFTLDAIVIHDGRIANLAVLRASRNDARGQAEVVEELLDAVSRARSAAPGDVSPNILRVVARETVRAKLPSLDLPLPPGKPAASVPPGYRATA